MTTIKFYIALLTLFASTAYSGQKDLSELNNDEFVQLAKSIDARQVAKGIAALGDRIEYCGRNKSKPLELPANFDFYGLDEQGKRNLIGLASFSLSDACTKQARAAFYTTLVANRLDQRAEFSMMVEPSVKNQLLDFKKSHEVEFKQFMNLINLDETYGGFDSIGTMEQLHLLDF